MRKKPAPKTAKARAWKAMSAYVRTKASVGGMCKCVTCGNWSDYAETDAGHFYPKGRSNAVRFDERNVHPQCQKCNRFEPEVAKIAYTRYMVEMYGQEGVDELLEEAKNEKRWRVDDLLEIEAHYKEQLQCLTSTSLS